MEREIKNKVVVISGGAVGIGYEIADKFLSKGAKVTILLDISKKNGVDAIKTLTSKYGENKAVFKRCDVTTDLEEVSKTILDEYKTVDVLVNNAGLVDETSVKKTIGTNTTALMEWSMKFWEHMRKDKGGKGGTILNIASLYGFFVDPFLPFYKASKHAVMGFSKTLGHEYSYNKFGVRVIVLCPGFTKTALTERLKVQENLLLEEFVEYMKTVEFLKPEDVGRAAVEIFEKADSGTAWKRIGSEPLTHLP